MPIAELAPGSDLGGTIPSVLELIRSREKGIKDAYRLVLCLEGGGMRGVVSGAMLIALRDLGLTNYFDAFYGTSSGSINLTYFSIGHDWDALAIYYDILTNGFVRQGRERLYKTPLNMDYVFDRVFTAEFPIDPDQIALSPFEIYVTLANVDSQLPELRRIKDSPELTREFLIASSWLPLLAGPPYSIAGTRYLDGGVLLPDPIYAAVLGKATHALILNTRSRAKLSTSSRTERRIIRTVLDRWEAGLGTEYIHRRQEWDRASASTPPGKDSSWGDVRCLRVAPALGAHNVERLTLDKFTLLEGARSGYETVMNAFRGTTPGHGVHSIVMC